MTSPALTISIPSFDRPTMIRRTIGSILQADVASQSAIELLICDDSSDDRVELVARPLLARWNGPARYVRNSTRLGLVDNFNRCVELSTAEHVMIVHDDDYLLPGAATRILAALQSYPDEHVMLFGVHVVDERGWILRRQEFMRTARLEPKAALKRVLAESSFVRFPAIVVRRNAFEEVGLFDSSLGSPTDFEMWTRLFARFGVRCMADVIAAYSVHDKALTAAMFDSSTIETFVGIFDRVKSMDLLSEDEIENCEADWLHQFILAGAYRRLRHADRPGARATLRLLKLPVVSRLGRSRRWLAVRIAMSALVLLPTPMTMAVVRLVDREYVSRRF